MDNFQFLREILWCDHVKLSFQRATQTSTHVALFSKQYVHIIVEDEKVKIICPECFVEAMRTRRVG